jgi:hypothetical protein
MRAHEQGFVGAELALGVGLLLFPVALLVLTMPSWSERQTTGRVIARETARVVARAGRCDRDQAVAVGRTMAHNLGLSADDVHVRLGCDDGAPLEPGSEVQADVTVDLPAVDIPGIGPVGAWSWTARHREPVDVFVGVQ